MVDFPRANYGPNEQPRACLECQSGSSRVRWTETEARTKYRYRTCNDCGAQFTTTEKPFLAPQGASVE